MQFSQSRDVQCTRVNGSCLSHRWSIRTIFQIGSQRVQLNQFMPAMPKKIKQNLPSIFLEMQLKEALRLGIINKFIEVYLNDHHEYYYGSNRSTNNPTIIGTNKGKGTNRMRNCVCIVIRYQGRESVRGLLLRKKSKSIMYGHQDALKASEMGL